MKPTVGEYQSVVRNIRKEEVVLAQICISHTTVIHSYLQQGEERPQCIGCNSSFVIPNILLEYDDFSQVRNTYFYVGNMKQLFQDKQCTY